MKVVDTDPAPALENTAAYIAEMADELRRLADTNDMVFVAYLLAMAATEARTGSANAASAPEKTPLRVVNGLGRHA